MAPKSAAMKTLRATRKNIVARDIQLKEASDAATRSSPSKSDWGASASRKVILVTRPSVSANSLYLHH
ncbi:uncharacterized protein DS421_19g664950 [Arachis hypogaea]|uniref:Uncharacterized protein n=1 Tax=Arachis hypogaea TaxID=3818 RepID=A0A6B9VDV7_ARAHY|nr:uncharacterized protein DS421_19g664950 [Arachis hypogaea]